MTRITKDPEIRRNEILDAAEELFIKEGFENTPVSSIVKKVGVAQGTFYYYFKSKEELLKGVIERIFASAKSDITLVVDSNEDALSKLIKIIQIIFEVKYSKEDFFKYIHEDRNALLHQKLENELMEILTPIFCRVLDQGLRDKVFLLDYIDETAELLLVLIGYLYDSSWQSAGEENRKVKAVKHMIEKSLGIIKGKLEINI